MSRITHASMLYMQEKRVQPEHFCLTYLEISSTIYVFLLLNDRSTCNFILASNLM
jgi:hypothetical protein